MTESAHLLRVDQLNVHIRSRDGLSDLHIIKDMSFTLDRGQTLGIVGESGSGKSTVAHAIMRTLPATGRISGGTISFDGAELSLMDEEQLRHLRGSRMAMIMQEPMVALDPLFSIGSQMAEGLRAHTTLRHDEIHARSVELLEQVSIPSPAERLRQYPHQMSGGMLQRMVGAMAMSCDPELLIADEPTTALDPTAQAQILDVLSELQRNRNLATIVVTHDFGVTARLANRILVMYAGIAAELGPASEIFDNPRHPYTRALLASIPGRRRIHPVRDGRRARLPTIDGQPPHVKHRPPGCPFAPRCPLADARCVEQLPPVTKFRGDHSARCWNAEHV